VLGGLFNALIAPALFDRLAEYPLAIVLALLLVAEGRPGGRRRGDVLIPALLFGAAAPAFGDLGGVAETPLGIVAVVVACGVFARVAATWRSRATRLGLGVGAVRLASGLAPGVGGRVVHRERNFYGTLRVTQDDRDRMRRLFHGNTLHGQQSLDPARRREPLA